MVLTERTLAAAVTAGACLLDVKNSNSDASNFTLRFIFFAKNLNLHIHQVVSCPIFLRALADVVLADLVVKESLPHACLRSTRPDNTAPPGDPPWLLVR